MTQFDRVMAGWLAEINLKIQDAKLRMQLAQEPESKVLWARRLNALRRERTEIKAVA